MGFWKKIDSAPVDGSWFLVLGQDIRVPAHGRMAGNALHIHTLQEVHGNIITDKNDREGLVWHPMPKPWNTP